MLTKVMVAHIDVFGPQMKFRQTHNFQSSRIVLKNIAVNMWVCADHLEAMSFHLL